MYSLILQIFLSFLALVGSWKPMKHLIQAITQKKLNKKMGAKLPPAPPRLPIIGHLHLVGSHPHRSFQKLAKKYGPLMHLKLGYRSIIVVSSPEMAETVFKKYESKCAQRPVSLMSREITYGIKGIAFTPSNRYWRDMRKLGIREVLGASKIQSFAWLRKEEIKTLVETFKSDAKANQPIDVGLKLTGVLEDLIYRMVYGDLKEDNLTIKDIFAESLRIAGTLNVADYLPFLERFDFQGLKRRIKAVVTVADDVMEKIIDKHEDDEARKNRSDRDIVDEMVSIMKNNNNDNNSSSYAFDRDNMKATLIDLVVPAMDSATNTVKWALANLLKHPEKMRKLQDEIESAVGGKNQMVEETDLPDLRYLDSVIKETFRLYPMVFSPREAVEDYTFEGYFIPKGAIMFLNGWAIGRDPKVWSDDCEEFRPERFMEMDFVDVIKGQDFRLTPFGSGRRSCPGAQLGFLNVKLLLAQLVHCFNWKMPNGKSAKDIDLQEKFGLIMSMTEDLVLVPEYRLEVKA